MRMVTWSRSDPPPRRPARLLAFVTLLRALFVLVPCLLPIAAALAQEAVLAGRVLTRTGERAGGATLRLRWRVGPELPGLCGRVLGDAGLAELAAHADERGAFAVPLPHRGPFEVTAERAGDRSPLAFPVMAGAFLELRLAEPTVVAGIVRGPDGEPLAGAAVALTPDLSAWSKLAAYRQPEWRGRTTTDAEGRFTLPFHDSYLQGRRWEPFVLPDVRGEGLALTRQELLRPTQHCRELELQLTSLERAHPRVPGKLSMLPLPPPFTGQPPTVRVQLRSGGQPLADATILWARQVKSGPPQEVLTRSDARGVATQQALTPDGTLLGFVERRGTWLPFARLRLGAADVDLGVVDVVERSLTGQVLDADGQPIAGARLVAMPSDPLDAEPWYVGYSDHGGRFRFAALPAVALRVWAECADHGFASAGLDASQTAVDLRTPAGGVVLGSIVDPAGSPVAGAWVVLIRQGQGAATMPGLSAATTILCTHSDAEGRVHVRGLPDGEWQVLCNVIRDGRLFGGGADVATAGDFVVRLRLQAE